MKRRHLLIIFVCLLLTFIGCKKEKTIKINYIINDQTITEIYQVNTKIYLPEQYLEDYMFMGWFDNPRFLNEKITYFESDVATEVTFYGEFITNESYINRINVQKVVTMINLINSLPNKVTIENLETVNEIRKLYDSVEHDYQEQVVNYQIFLIKETKVNELASTYQKIATSFDDEVFKLSFEVSPENLTIVDKLLEKYNYYDEYLKMYITSYDRLCEFKEQLDTELNDVSCITYVLGQNIYETKDDLFNSLFEAFYNFLNIYYPDSLENEEIDNVETFKELALDYDAGRGSLRYLGDLFGDKFLTKDLNGLLKNQPTNTFLGYLYHHQQFIEFIEAYQVFFAYWRLDEGYANDLNYGADLLAEGWAALVDLCKFFYYDRDSSYVHTRRVLDLLNNVPGVINTELYRELNETLYLQNNIKLRGYTFVGWYDNPEFDGEPITFVEPSGEKIVLYACFVENATQQNSDLVKYINVYIDNLLTSEAVFTYETCIYIYELYESLPNANQKLIENYSIILDYLDNYSND